MRRRSTDESDKISEKEIKEARINWWKAMKLCFANLPLIVKAIVLIVGVMGGTIAAPEAYRMATNLIQDPLPTPDGSLPPAPTTEHISSSAFQAQAAQSFTALNDAVNTHTAALEALREEIRNLESRLAAKRARGDNNLSERVSAIEEVVQP